MTDLIPSLAAGIPFSPPRPKRVSVYWTADEKETFAELWKNQDLSLARIGEIMGKTRNACAGQRYRLDLPHRQPSGPNGLSTTTQRVRRAAARQSNLAPLPRKPRSPMPRLAPLPKVTSPSVTSGVHIADLESHHCRFITHQDPNDGLARYCGAGRMPAYDRYGNIFFQSWCAEHCEVCLAPKVA